MPLLKSLAATFEMIKWEHSIFALPFSLLRQMLAANGVPTGASVWSGSLVAMISSTLEPQCRSIALLMPSIDAADPRTRTRAIASRTSLTPDLELCLRLFVVLSCCRLLVSRRGEPESSGPSCWAGRAGRCFSSLTRYTKRFTRWSHLVLGFALGIAPAAAWIAVRGSLDPRILLLTAAVTFWVSGLRRAVCLPGSRLRSHCRIAFHSAVLRRRQITLDRPPLSSAHVVVAHGSRLEFRLGKIAAAGVLAVLLLIGYEHSLVSKDDLSKLNAAFFTMNGVIAVVFFVFLAVDLLPRHMHTP